MVDSDADRDLLERLNPHSWDETIGYVETYLEGFKPGDKVQFVRNGYWNTDDDSQSTNLIFNRTVELKSGVK